MAKRLGGTGMFAAPDAIFERDDLRATDKLVYLYLCRRAGPDGTSWPSVRRIASDTGIVRNTVRACISRLEQAGLLKKEPRQSDFGDSDSYLYTIVTSFEKVGQSNAVVGQMETHVGQTATQGVGQSKTQGGSNGDPEGCTVKDAQSEGIPPNPPTGDDAVDTEPQDSPYPPEFEEFWSAYPLKLGKTEACQCWEKCLRDARPRVTQSQLLAAAKHYSEACRLNAREKRHIKRATTFLNPKKRRWEDYVDGVPEAERPTRTPTREPPQPTAPPQHYL